jgi:hypothetical protein
MLMFVNIIVLSLLDCCVAVCWISVLAISRYYYHLVHVPRPDSCWVVHTCIYVCLMGPAPLESHIPYGEWPKGAALGMAAAAKNSQTSPTTPSNMRGDKISREEQTLTPVKSSRGGSLPLDSNLMNVLLPGFARAGLQQAAFGRLHWGTVGLPT